MSIQICEEHEVAYIDHRKGAQGHINFNHHDEPDFAFREVDDESQIPEGYERKTPPPPKSSRAAAASNVTAQRLEAGPALPPEAATDPDAYKLSMALGNIGMTPPEITNVLRAYSGFEVFRTDPHQLHALIERNMIQSKRFINFIPLVVQEMLGNNAPQVPAAYYGTPQRAAQYQYYPLSNPTSTVGYNYPPGPGALPGVFQPPVPWWLMTPPAATKPGESEITQIIRENQEQADRRFEALQNELKQEREERRREAEERKREEERRVQEERFAKLEEKFLGVTQMLATSAQQGPKSDETVAVIREELRAIREAVAGEKDRQILGYISALNRKIDQAQAQAQVGRSTEDLLADIAPRVLDVVQQGGNRLSQEVKELREQVVPRASEASLTPGSRQIDNNSALTDDELIEQGQLENDLLGIGAEPPDTDFPDAYSGEEEQDLAPAPADQV